MTQLFVWILLMLGSLSALIAAVGVLVMPNIYTRLHYLGLASTISMISIAAAIAVQKGIAHQSTGEAVLAALVVVITSPVISHATARAARIREQGSLDQVDSTTHQQV